MTRTAKVKESVLDVKTQIILLENVQNHRETRAKEHSSKVLGATAVKKMMKKSKTKHMCLGIDLEPDEQIKDIGCSKHMTGNQKLFSTYKAYNGGNVIFGSNLRDNTIGKGQICDNKCRVTFSEHDSEITKDSKVIESLNVTFDETPPPSKTLPLVDEDLDEEEAIKVTERKNLENDIEDETLEIEKYFAFGRHLEEIHVTWAHLEKKRTRLRTYTNIAQEFLLRSWRQRHRLRDATMTSKTASQDLKTASNCTTQPII
ncbi:hypothetical protein Tco_0907016 [Tanacetum coccineum]|uniref:Retrovirus-related Pol polyprotein from transposon TNT 1-94-like beta-barrel domain-containing protein n=1 Tax=Tanacetum coccineum TaxID=301880 RepID=A0ABQ5CI23_9ASTR